MKWAQVHGIVVEGLLWCEYLEGLGCASHDVPLKARARIEVFIGCSPGPAADDFCQAPPMTKRPIRLDRPSTCTAMLTHYLVLLAPHTSAAFTCRFRFPRQEHYFISLLHFITCLFLLAKCRLDVHDCVPYGLDMMEEYTADAFANRDEPVPALPFGNQDSTSSRPSKREKLKAKFGVNQNGKGSDENNDRSNQSGLSIQDRLFSRYGCFYSPRPLSF